MRLTSYTSSSEAPLAGLLNKHEWQADYPETAEAVREAWLRGETIRTEELRKELEQSVDFNASIYGSVGFRRLEITEEEPLVTNSALQKRLDALCEKLRAKY
jgi:NADPH-dependent ferric siderophore reductase